MRLCRGCHKTHLKSPIIQLNELPPALTQQTVYNGTSHSASWMWKQWKIITKPRGGWWCTPRISLVRETMLIAIKNGPNRWSKGLLFRWNVGPSPRCSLSSTPSDDGAKEVGMFPWWDSRRKETYRQLFPAIPFCLCGWWSRLWMWANTVGLNRTMKALTLLRYGDDDDEKRIWLSDRLFFQTKPPTA